MLAPNYLDHAPDALVALWQEVEDTILRDVARRIGKMDALTPTANWQLWRYQQTEAVRKDVVKLLAQYTGKSEAEIRRLMKEAATAALEAEDEIYYHYGKEPTPFEESTPLQNLLNAGYRQTAGSFSNLTATTANTVSGAFEQALDRAWLQVSSGAFDYKTAVKRAVDGLADSMPYVTYPSGHRDTLEVACRRAVLTGVNQTGAKLQEARMDEMGASFVEVTAHGGARPSHAVWQGRRYHRGGAVDYLGQHYEDFESATGYGTGAGLCGWNCRHTFFAVFPELGDPPAWTRDQLEELNARNIEYNGKRYTRYEINQMQRARERNVRRWKKRYLAETEAGADTTDAAVRLKAARQSLAEFAQATGGRVDSARVSVPKFGRSEAGKASYIARKQEVRCLQTVPRSGRCVPRPRPNAHSEQCKKTVVTPNERSFHHETRRCEEQDPRHHRRAAEPAHAGERRGHQPGEVRHHRPADPADRRSCSHPPAVSAGKLCKTKSSTHFHTLNFFWWSEAT